MGKEPKEKKSAKKEKKPKVEDATEEGATVERKTEVSIIAKPLADDKLSKKVRYAFIVMLANRCMHSQACTLYLL